MQPFPRKMLLYSIFFNEWKSVKLSLLLLTPPPIHIRAIPFEYTWGGGGGGGVERSPIEKSWGEGVKIKKIIGRGVCQILKKHGGGGGLPSKNIKSGVG